MTEELQDLYFRRHVCNAFLQLISQMDDPRKEDALANYRGQLAEIDAKITEREREERSKAGIPEPEPVVVGLKSASLFGKAN